MGSEGELFKFTALTAVLILLSTFVGYIRTVFLVRGSVKIDGALIMEYTHHILHLPTSFFQVREVGDINSRIGDIYRIRSFISGNLIMVSIATVSLVVSFVLLFSFYWKLAVVILGFIPLYITLFIIANHKNKEHNKKIIEASASFESSTIGAITSIETARFFSAQEHFHKRIEDRYVNLAIRMFKGGKSNALIISSIDFLNQITPFLAVTLGSLFVLRSELSIGELVSFYTITGFFTSPLSILIESTRQLNEARIAAQRVFEVMDMEIEEFEQINIPMPSDPAQCIRFDNVSFHYPGKRDLFNNLTFEAPKGKITSIAGKNGCGKSTVAALLMRAHEPASGSILSGNLNISQFSISEWRKHISIIPQRESLFDGTALENIVLGDNNPDIDKVLELCEAVGMIDFIKNQPKGLATPVGEGGKFLSAGERTKIALIRALYRSPQIIIMDEVTSHLDTSSSQMIIALARRLADEGKTIINITHDRKFLEISDYVVNI
jgi:ATP-binding cassette subfamily B protein